MIGKFDADSGFEVLDRGAHPHPGAHGPGRPDGPRPPEIIERLHTIEQTFAGRCRVIEGYDVNTAHTLLAARTCC